MRRVLALFLITGWALSALPARAATEDIAPPFTDTSTYASECEDVVTLVGSCSVDASATSAGALGVAVDIVSPNDGALPGVGYAYGGATIEVTHTLHGAHAAVYTVRARIVEATGGASGLLTKGYADAYFAGYPVAAPENSTISGDMYQEIMCSCGFETHGTITKTLTLTSTDGEPISGDVRFDLELNIYAYLGGFIVSPVPMPGSVHASAKVEILSVTADVTQ